MTGAHSAKYSNESVAPVTPSAVRGAGNGIVGTFTVIVVAPSEAGHTLSGIDATQSDKNEEKSDIDLAQSAIDRTLAVIDAARNGSLRTW